MKRKSVLFGLLIPLLALSACNPGTEVSSGGLPSTSLEENQIAVYFYISGPHADLKNPLYSTISKAGEKLSRPREDPVSPDPAYNTFLGWSDKVLALSEEDLWDFNKDVVPDNLKKPEFHLYGQWDYIEK